MNEEFPRFEIFRDRDLVELERMVFALYREDSYGGKMSRRKIRDTVWELSLHPSKGTIIVFRIGEAVVGYAIVIYYWSNEYGGDIVSIDELFVKPPWRRKGIGTSFIEYIATTKARYLKGLQVEVTPVNERALDFYSQRGFLSSENRYLFRKLHRRAANKGM
jgi:GNAT superfamily N-acetyltransferase